MNSKVSFKKIPANYDKLVFLAIDFEGLTLLISSQLNTAAKGGHAGASS